MTLYLAAFALPSANSGHHHHHGDDCGCEGHEHEEKHSHEGCCGGHGHEEGKEHECCGGHGHATKEEPTTGFEVFAKEVGNLYPDHLPLFPNLWLINTDKSHQEIYASLKHTVDSHSALWIIPCPKDSAGFLKPDALEWIKPRLYPTKK